MISGNSGQFSAIIGAISAIWGRQSPRKKPVLINKKKAGDCTPKMLILSRFGGLTKVFGRMSKGISGPKLPLWADSSFLNLERRRTSPICKALQTEALSWKSARDVPKNPAVLKILRIVNLLL